jgi:hypothetical protein
VSGSPGQQAPARPKPNLALSADLNHMLVNPSDRAAADRIRHDLHASHCALGDLHARDEQRPARAGSDQADGQIGRDPTGNGQGICTRTVRPDQIEDPTGAAICSKKKIDLKQELASSG